MIAHWLTALAIVACTVVALEMIASAVHRHVMHGWGWGWHRSHHEPASSLFQPNDLYALGFAAVSFLLFVAGAANPIFWWVGIGTAVYGLLYALVHDGLTHQRFPFAKPPRNGYLKRLVQAHRLHHSVRDRDGGVSFGFLYAPPVHQVLADLRAKRRRS